MMCILIMTLTTCSIYSIMFMHACIIYRGTEKQDVILETLAMSQMLWYVKLTVLLKLLLY